MKPSTIAFFLWILAVLIAVVLYRPPALPEWLTDLPHGTTPPLYEQSVP